MAWPTKSSEQPEQLGLIPESKKEAPSPASVEYRVAETGETLPQNKGGRGNRILKMAVF